MSDMTVSPLARAGMLSLRADLSEAGAKLSEALGIAVPAPVGVSEAEEAALLWFSPDELLLVCPPASLPAYQTRAEEALAGRYSMVTDVSDMRAGFEVRGPRLREVLAKLVPIDMHPEVFAPGLVRRTHLAQVPVAVWMRAQDTACVLCFRSVANYTQSCLLAAARPEASVGLVGK